MNTTVQEVLNFIKENDVQFIRLGFCDPFGVQKNISIMPDELPGAFKHGVSFDASAIKAFKDITNSDLLLVPDATTLTVLPWRAGPGRVVRFFCDIKNPDGSPFLHDSRYLLKRVVERFDRIGYVCKIGAECEFYLFKTDEKGEPTQIPLDKGGYFDIAPIDKGENIRREIALCLEEMGIKVETSHHEQGPGQNEIDFKFGDALSTADNMLNFKSVVKIIAERNGLFASFMAKPLLSYSGSGLHVNISLAKNGVNVFQQIYGQKENVSESFIAGILNRVGEITLFLNPTANSYERFGKFSAPRYISWSHQNRSQLVRIPAAIEERMRMELRSPDPTCNPYLAFALIMAAGLEGIEEKLVLPSSVDVDLYTAGSEVTSSLKALPNSLSAAIETAENSMFVKEVIGSGLLERYLKLKREEAAAFESSENKSAFYKDRYFDIL